MGQTLIPSFYLGQFPGLGTPAPCMFSSLFLLIYGTAVKLCVLNSTHPTKVFQLFADCVDEDMVRDDERQERETQRLIHTHTEMYVNSIYFKIARTHAVFRRRCQQRKSDCASALAGGRQDEGW